MICVSGIIPVLQEEKTDGFIKIYKKHTSHITRMDLFVVE